MSGTPTPTRVDDVRKQLPSAIEAEEMILSCLMEKDGSGLLCMKTFDQLTPESFYRPAHKALASWIQKQRASGSPCDVISLVTSMSASEDLREVFHKVFGENCASELVAIANKAATTAHFDWQVKQVKEAWVRRKGIAACVEAIDDFYGGAKDTDLLLADAQDKLSAITFDYETVMDEATATQHALVELEKEIAKGDKIGFSTGFDVLDSAMSILAGELITIAARTSMGKTALAAQLMDHLANAAGALYLTKEMRATALVKRLISKDIGRSTGAIRKGDANGMQSVMNSAQWRIQRNRLHYRDADTMTIATVETMVRVFTARGCRFFCIDYLQLMKPTKETAKLDRRHQIADITGRLKALAMKLEVTIFLVSQIARLEDDTRPELRNLSESKSIEDDSDKVILLHRTLGSRQAEVKVAKDRNGPTTGWLDLGFRPETTSFENLERA